MPETWRWYPMNSAGDCCCGVCISYEDDFARDVPLTTDLGQYWREDNYPDHDWWIDNATARTEDGEGRLIYLRRIPKGPNNSTDTGSWSRYMQASAWFTQGYWYGEWVETTTLTLTVYVDWKDEDNYLYARYTQDDLTHGTFSIGAVIAGVTVKSESRTIPNSPPSLDRIIRACRSGNHFHGWDSPSGICLSFDDPPHVSGMYYSGLEVLTPSDPVQRAHVNAWELLQLIDDRDDCPGCDLCNCAERALPQELLLTYLGYGDCDTLTGITATIKHVNTDINDVEIDWGCDNWYGAVTEEGTCLSPVTKTNPACGVCAYARLGFLLQCPTGDEEAQSTGVGWPLVAYLETKGTCPDPPDFCPFAGTVQLYSTAESTCNPLCLVFELDETYQGWGNVCPESTNCPRAECGNCGYGGPGTPSRNVHFKILLTEVP